MNPPFRDKCSNFYLFQFHAKTNYFNAHCPFNSISQYCVFIIAPMSKLKHPSYNTLVPWPDTGDTGGREQSGAQVVFVSHHSILTNNGHHF